MKLVIEDEAGTRSIVPFTGDTIVVGRGTEGVTFRLAERNVSRRHARFLRQNGVVSVEDLGSLLGTRVNGERISARRRLRDGDLVQIGDYDLAVLAEGAAAVLASAPPLPAAAPPPPPPRTDPNATTMRLASVPEPTPPELTPPAPIAAPPAPAPAPRPRGVARRALAIGLAALALGLAAGWAVGAFTAPPAAPPITAP